MEIVTKEYLENNIKAYDSYRGLGNKGKANGIATLDANGKLSNSQIPVLPVTKLAVAGTNNATTNAAVNSGTVYINTYDVTPGVATPTHNNAISIEGANGISVTANNGGQIIITGHKKPPILNTDNMKNSEDGNLVPKPSSTNTNLYLRADGVWHTPENTQVKLNGKVKDNSHTNTVASNGSGNAAEAVVQSISAGTGITLECDKNTGALTIIGSESGQNVISGTGQNVISGTGLRYIDDGTDRVISLKAATADELGGIKVGTLGTGDTSATVGTSSQTIYAPPASGKYYPIETIASGGHSGHAVVKIPDAPSPFYEEDTNDKFSIAIEDYKIISYMDKLSTVFTGETSWENTAIQAFLSQVNSQIEKDADKINTEEIFNDCLRYGSLQVTEKKGLSITCPSNVLTAQLDCSMVAYGMTLSVPIKSTKVSGKQTISIQNSYPNAGFILGETSYAYLRFTTEDQIDNNGIITSKGHTYNATITIKYTPGRNGRPAAYTPNIII